MEYSLERVDDNQKLLNQRRPLQGKALEEVQAYYRVALTYTSNAIEGNTLTVSETKIILEDGLTVAGHPLHEIYEATGHAAAYDLMWKLVKDKSICVEDVKSLHRLFYEQIDPEQAGQYRTQDVLISGSAHEVTAHGDIPAAMEELERWMASERDKYHPVVFAAELHRRFVYIHPFIDGNGRTARLLLNLALLQSGYEILTIPPVCRNEYISALERGHSDPRPFQGFIIDREVEAQKDMLRMFHIKKEKDEQER